MKYTELVRFAFAYAGSWILLGSWVASFPYWINGHGAFDEVHGVESSCCSLASTFIIFLYLRVVSNYVIMNVWGFIPTSSCQFSPEYIFIVGLAFRCRVLSNQPIQMIIKEIVVLARVSRLLMQIDFYYWSSSWRALRPSVLLACTRAEAPHVQTIRFHRRVEIVNRTISTSALRSWLKMGTCDRAPSTTCRFHGQVSWAPIIAKIGLSRALPVLQIPPRRFNIQISPGPYSLYLTSLWRDDTMLKVGRADGQPFYVFNSCKPEAI